MANEYGRIGFIGLGLMGLPMVENLIKKTSETTRFYVFDVSEEAVKKLCSEHSTRVESTKSSKEVAEKAVCTAFTPFK